MAVELDEAAPKTPAPQNGTGKAHKRHKSGGGGAPNGSLDAALGAKNLLGKLGAANVHANGANKDGAAAGGVSELPQRRINFVEMTVPDRALDQLRSKYPPINADAIKKAMKGHGSLGSEKGTGNQTSASAAGASPAAPPKEQILDPRHIPITWASVYPTAPGLVNLGNTCFLNASLQCIAHTAPLSEYLLSGHHSRTCRTKAATGMFCVTCELENLAKRMFRTGGGAGGGSFAPKGIVSNLRAVGKQFKVGRQEDAHEFVRMMVDAMQNSAVRSYFGKDVKR